MGRGSGPSVFPPPQQLPPPNVLADPTNAAKILAPLRNASNDTAASVVDRVAAFEEFRKSYRKNQVMEEHKELLKTKYAEAKVTVLRHARYHIMTCGNAHLIVLAIG
jgi:hypothetical protein